ncbi:M81 family metallopeptidase [Pelagibius sp. Alg239-R121]|uniref:M81 family metallopeptidase n=1 Tax=Pelagibius sp. Alg239-R121 TaxID=2993448 RepID=UPI0024A6F462|nr:M81 family metallopeptidase [Pelagibius sp. Alg239-R121]
MTAEICRIAVGGFQHETNTFAPTKAQLVDFETPSAWPGLTRGQEMFEAVAGVNIPIAGFIETAQASGFEIAPLSWSAASPSAQVTQEAFETIVGGMLADLSGMTEIDAVYLDLHGAMVTEHLDDGEGAFLERLRNQVGPELPVVVSLDLHANITPEMMTHADALVVYRTYPHVDMAVTGARAARLLERIIIEGRKPAKAFCQLPFMIPLTSGCTFQEPAKSLYRQVAAEEGGKVWSASFACGFNPADFHHAGPSALAYADDQETADGVAQELRTAAVAHESEFAPDVLAPETAVSRAKSLSSGASRPVILADAQDNPGGGADSNAVELLEECLKQGVEQAALALLFDPETASAAHLAGEGTEIRVRLGCRYGSPGKEPLETLAQVLKLGDGKFEGTGPFYRGARMELGPMALLQIGGIKVVVGSRQLQAADQEIFRHLGIEPREMSILILKSSVHFRADFEPIAEEILVVAAPGPNVIDNDLLEFKKLRPDIRRMPRKTA